MFMLRVLSAFILFFGLNCFLQANSFSYSDELKLKLFKAYQSQPKDYRPRTQYFCKNNQPCYTNRLILESSPYLLQHAHNPINWFSWGEEAFEKAKRENKPIFLSVGYASCHWCHVMEEESFDNVEIAKILNENFIAIKVDRERRPDIDELYGSAMNYFIGQQGWPMSIFLTHDAKPFDGGGYYPFKDFKALLIKNSQAWVDQNKKLLALSDSVMEAIQTHRQLGSAIKINDSIRQKTIKQLLGIVDNYQGGFGEGSKFPREPWLNLFVNESYGKSEKNDSLTALNNTLQHIARGGIYDQLAGGFHRYSVDANWKIPHFEKMLYNQALLISIYLQVNTINPNELYQRVVNQTANFLINTMQSPNGGFYASLDAGNKDTEGDYYLWTVEQWNAALNKQDAMLFSELYDVEEYGETESAKNVLYLFYSLAEFSENNNISEDTLLKKIRRIKKQLLSVRSKREPPLQDKKIIMAWNGLAITALTRSYQQFHEEEYLSAAVKAANFIWHEMQKDGHFYRVYFKNKRSIFAQLEDYSLYLQALISLYDVTQEARWLQRAKHIEKKMIDCCWDDKNGGFYNTALDKNANLPIRPKTAFDKTLPSANSIASQMLMKLYRRTGKMDYKDKAQMLMSSFSEQLVQVPSAFSSLLIADEEFRNGENELPIYVAQGNIRIDAYLKHIKKQIFELNVAIKMDDLWHINSFKPFEKNLIPTRIQLKNKHGWEITGIQYPADELIKLGFNQREMALYQGDVHIKSTLIKFSTELNPVINLQLQACDDKICLPPEELTLYPRLINENK